MTDARTRELHRRWQETGGPDDRTQWLRSLIRSGSARATAVATLLATFGDEPTRLLLEELGEGWPTLPKRRTVDMLFLSEWTGVIQPLCLIIDPHEDPGMSGKLVRVRMVLSPFRVAANVWRSNHSCARCDKGHACNQHQAILGASDAARRFLEDPTEDTERLLKIMARNSGVISRDRGIPLLSALNVQIGLASILFTCGMLTGNPAHVLSVHRRDLSNWALQVIA